LRGNLGAPVGRPLGQWKSAGRQGLVVSPNADGIACSHLVVQTRAHDFERDLHGVVEAPLHRLRGFENKQITLRRPSGGCVRLRRRGQGGRQQQADQKSVSRFYHLFCYRFLNRFFSRRLCCRISSLSSASVCLTVWMKFEQLDAIPPRLVTVSRSALSSVTARTSPNSEKR